MKCFHCGKNIPENVKFCSYCGISQEYSQPARITGKPAEPVKKRVHPLAIILPVAAVLLIAAVILLLLFTGGKQYIFPQNTFWCYYDEESDMTEVYINGSRTEFTASGEVLLFQSDYTGESALVLTEDASLYSVSADGNFWRVSRSVYGFTWDKKDVYACQLALNGKTIAYINEDNELYSHQVSSGESVKIADRVTFCQISPDGKTFAYRVEEDGDASVCLYRNGKAETVAGSYYPAAVTDKGILYLLSEHRYLYRINTAGGMDKLTGDPVSRIMLNRTCSELIYENSEDGRLYLIGEELPGKIALGNYGTGECLLPSSLYSPASGSLYSMLDTVECLPVNTFADQLFLYTEESGERSLVMMTGQWQSYKLAEGVTDWSFSDTGETLYYSRNGSLYLLEMADVRSPQKLSDEVVDFAASFDGDRVFYITEDNKGNTALVMYDKTAKRPAPAVMSKGIRHILMSPQNCLYYLGNYDEEQGSGTLYACTDAEDSWHVAEGVHSITTFGLLTAIWSEYDAQLQTCDLQISEDSVRTALLKTEIGSQSVNRFRTPALTDQGKSIPKISQPDQEVTEDEMY